jgi:iron complex outermembrane receptor protein
VLVDGRPTREPIYGQTHIDPDFVVPMEAVERVEVVRGPGSALYGSNAVFGVINVVTKDAADLPGRGQVRVQGGTKETGRVAGLLGHKPGAGNLLGEWDVIGAASAFTTEGDDEIRYDGVNDAARNFGKIEGFDHEDAESAFVKARRGDLTLQFDYARRQKDNRSATYLTSFFDPGDMVEKRANFTARYDRRVGDDRSLHAMAYVGYYLYEQNYQYDDDGNGRAYRYFTEGESTWVGGEVHYDWQASKAFHLTLGAEGTQTLSTRQNDRDTVDGDLLDVEASFNSWGVFAEGELKLTDGLTLTGGLRLDHVQRVGTLLSPRAALVATPSREDTVKLLYGRAFRAPNLYEMFYAAPGTNVGNTDLDPEIVDTYEVVWEHDFRNGFRTSANYYYWVMTDALGDFAAPGGELQTRNVGNIYAQGVEFEVQRRWEDGARARAYATLGRAVRDGEQLTHSPEWVLGTSVAVPVFNRKTFLAVEPQVVGPMRTDFGASTNPTFVTNLVLTSRDVFEGVDVQVGVYNLFGDAARLPRNSPFDHSQPSLNYPEPLFLASLTYRF